MKLIRFCAPLFFGGFCHAATYTTSVGAVFTQVQDKDFGVTWREPDQGGTPGKIWSGYIGEYDNNALKPDDATVLDERGGAQITESHATLACERLNGKLPSTEDYNRMRTYFEIGGGGLFSPQGRSDLQNLFPDMAGRWFWTRFATPDTSQNLAGGFNGYTGFVDYYGAVRDTLRSVRCIH